MKPQNKSQSNDPFPDKKMSELLLDIRRNYPPEGFTFQTLMEHIGPRGHMIVSLFLTIPFCQPIPMLGLSTPFGMVIMTIALCYAAGIPPWLPKSYRKRVIPEKILFAICDRGSAILRGIEKFAKPRGRLLNSHPSLHKFCGIQIAILAFFLALPIPIPGTNVIPAIPMIALSLGLLEEDGYIVGLGIVGFFISVCFFVGVPFFIFFGLDHYFGIDLRKLLGA